MKTGGVTMIYLGAVGVGILLALRVICLTDLMRKRTYEIRIKEVKEELTQKKLGTEHLAQNKSL